MTQPPTTINRQFRVTDDVLVTEAAREVRALSPYDSLLTVDKRPEPGELVLTHNRGLDLLLVTTAEELTKDPFVEVVGIVQAVIVSYPCTPSVPHPVSE